MERRAKGRQFPQGDTAFSFPATVDCMFVEVKAASSVSCIPPLPPSARTESMVTVLAGREKSR